MQQRPSEVIYHLVIEGEFRHRTVADTYTPLRFDEDGFMHCTAGRELLLQVANDYFAHVTEPVVVIEIDVTKLTAELRLELPMPIAGGGQAHVQAGLLFPHIYGPLNLDAVVGIGRLRRPQGEGPWQWPQQMRRLEDFHSTPEDGA